MTKTKTTRLENLIAAARALLSEVHWNGKKKSAIEFEAWVNLQNAVHEAQND